LEEIQSCKERGVKVVLSLNGKRKSKVQDQRIKIPEDLFEKKIYINCGLSMINRLQKNGQTVQGDDVNDLLLLTY
jgi:DNA adenine methylase